MARIVFTSMGYWGDVMPYVPVANRLAGRGHHVRFCVPDGFHEVLGGERFELCSAGGGFSPRELAGHGDVLADLAMRMGGFRLGRWWVRTGIVPHLEPMYEALARAAEGADLIVTHSSLPTSRMVAEKLGVPFATGHLFPMLLPTAEHPPPMWPAPSSPRLNRLGWTLGDVTNRLLLYDRPINAFRRRLGLPPVLANATRGGVSPLLTLVLTSKHYFPVPSDWPSHYRAVGFTRWEGPAGSRCPPEVERFLDAGEPPVLVTLGTSAATNAQDFFETVAEILDSLGARGLFLTGQARGLPGRSGAWPFAPLPAVAPRCGAAIHAGGHGTNAALLHAGVPAVIVPQTFDQDWHAARLESLGVARPVAWRRRSPARLREAIADVLSSERYRLAAKSLAASLATEDGPSTAADEIERVVAPVRSS